MNCHIVIVIFCCCDQQIYENISGVENLITGGTNKIVRYGNITVSGVNIAVGKQVQTAAAAVEKARAVQAVGEKVRDPCLQTHSRNYKPYLVSIWPWATRCNQHQWQHQQQQQQQQQEEDWYATLVYEHSRANINTHTRI